MTANAADQTAASPRLAPKGVVDPTLGPIQRAVLEKQAAEYEQRAEQMKEQHAAMSGAASALRRLVAQDDQWREQVAQEAKDEERLAPNAPSETPRKRLQKEVQEAIARARAAQAAEDGPTEQPGDINGKPFTA